MVGGWYSFSVLRHHSSLFSVLQNSLFPDTAAPSPVCEESETLALVPLARIQGCDVSRLLLQVRVLHYLYSWCSAGYLRLARANIADSSTWKPPTSSAPSTEEEEGGGAGCCCCGQGASGGTGKTTTAYPGHTCSISAA